MKDEAERKWISGDGEGEDEFHTIVMKSHTLFGWGICRKLKVDESKMEARISYFPMVLYSNKPSYIWNDEDVFGYLLQVNHEKYISVLHVEFNNVEVKISEGDDETDVDVSLSIREATDIEGGDEYVTEKDATEGTDGMLTFYEDTEMHENVTKRDEHVFEDT